MARPFEDVRPTSWRVIALAIIAWTVASTLLNFLGGRPEIAQAMGAVARATGGLVQPPLLVGPLFLAAVGTAIFGAGRLRAVDVGWRPGDIGPAVLATLGFWAAMQAVLALWIIGSDGELRWNEAWPSVRIGPFVGGLAGQLLANALLEELVFRGFLLPHLYLSARRRLPAWAALAAAVLGSSLLFAVTHIPHRIFFLRWPAESLAPDQLKLLFFGMTYAAIYLVTRNLFVCIGLHAIFNQPAALAQAPFWPGPAAAWYEPNVSTAWCAAVLLLLIAWSMAGRLVRTRRRAPAAGCTGDTAVEGV
jgi:hypothetical protein